MKRALQLAVKGYGRVSPNPMVGAVIVHGDRIIGEGFHAFYGGPHAEVNAINSVKEEDKPLLKDSTIYVTLEPCSHHGKTPPCADLIVKTEIPEVVVGAMDPNPKVSGNGYRKLLEAGIKVKTGVLEKECKDINRKFMKAHTSERPWITLKWAQSSDGFMAALNEEGQPMPVKFSSPLSQVWMHRERAGIDAILVGANTENSDKPRLDTRMWGGNSPRKLIAKEWIDCREFVSGLKKQGVTSLMVEGGPTLLKSFLKDNLYDEIRVEISPVKLREGLPSPEIPEAAQHVDSFFCRDNIIRLFRR